MNLNPAIDIPVIKRLIESQYAGKQTDGFVPVNYSFMDFRKNIFPGKIGFYGSIILNPSSMSSHTAGFLNHSYFMFLGRVRYTHMIGAIQNISEMPILFDDIMYNQANMLLETDYESVSARTTEIPIRTLDVLAPPFDTYNVPYILFSGYKFQLNG